MSLKKAFFVFLALLIFGASLLDATESKLNQKIKPSERNSNLVRLVDLKKLSLDFNKTPLKKVRKISIHEGRLYILESQRDEIFVLDNNGKYLYSIGRPGQGPGDLEYPSDFFISKNRVYVLNSIPRRIEIFDLKGQYVSRIHLKCPHTFFYPNSFVVTEKNFIVGTDLNELVSLFDRDGNYRQAILKRTPPVELPSTGVIGYPAQLAMFKGSILHFNMFSGEFTKLKENGNIASIFSGHSRAKTLEQKIRNDFNAKRSKSGNRRTSIKLYSSCCIDDKDLIYMIPLVNNKPEEQKMFVFNSNGTLFCQTWPESLSKTFILDFCCDGDNFMLLSYDFDLFRCKRRIYE